MACEAQKGRFSGRIAASNRVLYGCDCKDETKETTDEVEENGRGQMNFLGSNCRGGEELDPCSPLARRKGQPTRTPDLSDEDPNKPQWRK